METDEQHMEREEKPVTLPKSEVIEPLERLTVPVSLRVIVFLPSAIK